MQQTMGTRITLIDALRGFAMMGIIMVNFPSINTLPGQEATEYGFISSTFDRLVADASMLILNSKVYPIFAMLFGLGMAIFLDHARRRQHAAVTLMYRRLSFLLVLGLVHICLVWWGDILFIYAVLGFVALAVYRYAPRMLLVFIALLLSVIPLLKTGLALVAAPVLETPLALLRFSPQPDTAIHEIYRTGTFATVVEQRLLNYLDYATPLASETLADALNMLNYYTQMCALILLGLYAGLKGWHFRAQNEPRTIDRTWWLLAVMLLCGAACGYALPILAKNFAYLFNTVLALFYIVSFAKAYRWRWFARVAGLFVPVGKLSMSVYLAHTSAASLFLYGYGLGFYGNIGPGLVMLAALGFACVAVAASHAWSSRYRFGPFEWLWRTVTYGHAPAMRLAPPAPAVTLKPSHQ